MEKPLLDISGEVVAERYRLEQLIGDGGMGSVYLAQDLQLNCPIALKLLKPVMCENDEAVTRFLREFQLTRQVTHKNVVRTYDIGLERKSKFIYFTMEYIEGESLGEILRRGRYPLQNAKDMLLAILAGLDEIHRCGIIHRDLKPTNILVTRNEIPKIADFGIARPRISDLTQSWEIVGSASYLAPEMWRGEPPTSAVDLYALGVTAYELTTGRVPFKADSQWEFMKTVMSTEAKPPVSLEPKVPAWLDRLILMLLKKDPKQRPASVQEVISYINQESEPACEKTSPRPASKSENKPRPIELSKVVPQEKQAASLSHGTVLVVDDDPVVRNLLQAILESVSYSVFSVDNGREAIKLLQQKEWSEKIDILFLDVQMPYVDGHEVLAWVRNHSHLASLPVIMLTSLSESEQILEGYAGGADYYITKPFTKDQLLYGLKMITEA